MRFRFVVDDAYGAWSELSMFSGIPVTEKKYHRRLHWQHGWLSVYSNKDPDLVVGEDGRAREQKKDAFLVARSDQVEFLKAQGFLSVGAIGLPFAYAMANQSHSKARVNHSLLVMPGGHSTDEDAGPAWPDDSEYIDYVKEVSAGFETLQVSLHGADIARGRSAPWETAGMTVVRGADYRDPTSLQRLANLFASTETVMSNDLGSHVVYASASGCRVSISGPSAHTTRDLSRSSFYRNRPDLISRKREIRAELEGSLKSMGFFVEPRLADVHSNWGREQIGWANLLSPDEVGPLLSKLSKFPYDRTASALRNIPIVSAGLSGVLRRIRSFRGNTSL